MTSNKAFPCRTEEEEQKLWQKSDAEHEYAISTTGALSFMVKGLYSQRLVEEYTVVPDPTIPTPPSSLGLWLSDSPNSRTMADVMKGYGRVPIGMVIPWHRDIIRGNLIRHHVLIRINAPQRWIHLTVTRYETDSREEILKTFLKTLDAFMFDDPYWHEKIIPLSDEWMIWNPVSETLTMTL